MTALPLIAGGSLGTSTIAPDLDDALLAVYRRAPIEIVRGEGIELIDADGNRYLDFTSGIAVNALGYGNPGIAEAVQRAMQSGVVHASNLYHTAPARELAKALTTRSFAERVFFCNSGAEANEGALKFARRWARAVGGPAKHEIVALRGAFHGRLFATLAATDRPHYRAPFRPLAGGITIVERDVETLARALDADTVAAVIAEPIQGEGGVRVLEPALLRALREITRERRIALVFDEIQCGLGRTGWLFAYERAGIVPDIVTLAKPLAGGLPMGAALVSGEIASAVQVGDHASTFGGGPVVATVARYVLERLSDPHLLARVREDGEWLGSELTAMAERSRSVRAVRGIGFIWGIDVMRAAGDVVSEARENGLLLCTAGEHTVRLLPPLIARRAELARGLAILEEVLR